MTQVHYNQSSEQIDYDNPTKFYINDSTADLTSDDISSTEMDKDAAATEEEQNLVVYSSDPNTDKYKAKQSIFAKYPEFEGIEASESVTLYYSTSKKAIDHEVEHEEEQQKQEQQPETSSEATSGRGTGQNSSSKKTSDSGKGNNNSGGKEAKAEQDENGGGAGEQVDVVDTTGAFTEPPASGSIAAFGDAAVMVQMVGGEGSLAATDATTLKGGFSKVFKDEGADKIATGWTDSGSAGHIDAKAIVKSGADVILQYTGDYQNNIDAKSRKILKDAGIKFVTIAAPTNTTYIKKDVKTIGKMLADSETAHNATIEGGTEGVASDYADYFDSIISKCVSANGGKLASNNDTVYELKNSGRYSFNSKANYTLLITGFDTSATFSKKCGGWSPVCNGAAMTTIGYSDTPVSFYIQAGGLINNAAALSSGGNSESIIAYQFNTNIMSMQKSNWSYAEGGLVDQSHNVTVDEGSGWKRTVFNTGQNAGGNGAASSFGSEIFPNIITATQTAKDKIVANSKDKNGLYHPYDIVSADNSGISINFIGKLATNGTSSIYSSIGVEADGTTSSWSGKQIPSSAVYVNPTGLVGSWTGNSVESFLEATWVNDVVAGNSTTVGWKSIVKEFYEKFFRYDLTTGDLNTIEDGEK